MWVMDSWRNCDKEACSLLESFCKQSQKGIRKMLNNNRKGKVGGRANGVQIQNRPVHLQN